MKKIAITLEVANQAQAMELNEAWQEIVSGKKLPRAEALEHATEAVMERARVALKIIETAIRDNPTTGQAGRLVRFLAGVYNGEDYPFVLTELRALDTELANACLDYLNYDRLAKREVHHHLAGGDRALHGWMKDCGVEPPPHLTRVQRKELAQLTEQTGHDEDDEIEHEEAAGERCDCHEVEDWCPQVALPLAHPPERL